MISLVLAMVWNRRGQAVTLALLAMLAVASAVAAPAYLIAAERAVVEGQVATATPRELSLTAWHTVESQDDPSAGITFPDVGRALLLGLNGFTFYHSAEMPTVGLERANDFPTRLVFRQDVCAHLHVLTGRCLAGEGDVLLGERTAQRLELRAGDRITLTAALRNGLARPPTWEPSGAPKTLTVAGIYRANDTAEPYWGLHGYFVAIAGLDGGAGEPVFTNATTLETMVRTKVELSIDGIAAPGTLDADRLGVVRADMERLRATSAELEESLQFDSGIPQLLDRIERGQAGARLLVPVLSVPLVLLACFTIYLVVGYGAESRQSELAVVALRGSRWWTRWWLATGESLVAVLGGAVAGCLAGQLLVNVAAGVLYPGVGAAPALSSLRYAPVAAAAALVAAVAAQRRQLTGPVARLLRRTPAADHRRLAAAEAVLAALAVACGFQYYLSDESLTGVGLFAPALIVLAVAVLSARLLLPLVSRFAESALRRGRLGAALAGLQLSRRPGAGRLFALLVASVAVAGYAACSVDTAARGRAVEASVGTGADRVLTVEDLGRQQLLNAVRAVDPRGDFAMAVVRIPAGAGAPDGIAVDARALPAVAAWPEGAVDRSRLSEILHPEAPDPLTFAGPDIVMEAEATGTGPLRLAVSVAAPSGPGGEVLDLGEIRPGTHTYRQKSSLCENGCRFQSFEIAGLGTATKVTGQVTIRSLNTATPAPLTDPGSWRGTQRARLSATPDGLRAEVSVSGAVADTAWIHPVSTPYPLPIAYAGPPPNGTIPDSGPAAIAVAPVVGLPVVPSVGRHAVLVDLEYADRVSVKPVRAPEPQVWLNDRAPADIVERLAEQGLTVVSEVSAAQVKERLDWQGPAIALWFHVLAAILAGLLGAGALGLTVAVDRARRTEDLTALRAQGLRPRPAGLATLWTYPVLVIIATAVGLLVAVAAWRLTGWAMPLAGLDPPDLPRPGWPRPAALLVAAGVVFGLQFLVAVFSGRNLRSRIESR